MIDLYVCMCRINLINVETYGRTDLRTYLYIWKFKNHIYAGPSWVCKHILVLRALPVQYKGGGGGGRVSSSKPCFMFYYITKQLLRTYSCFAWRRDILSYYKKLTCNPFWPPLKRNWNWRYKCKLHLFTALMQPNLIAVMIKTSQIISSCRVTPGQPKN